MKTDKENKTHLLRGKYIQSVLWFHFKGKYIGTNKRYSNKKDIKELILMHICGRAAGTPTETT